MRRLTAYGLTLLLASAPGALAQTLADNFREISSQFADRTKLLSCSSRSDVPPEAYVYFNEAGHAAGFHVGSANDGRVAGAHDAVVTNTTVSWKTPGITDALGEETFTLDRKTGQLDAELTYPAPAHHLTLHCSEDEVYMADPGPGMNGKWVEDFNAEHLCDSDFPNGIHSSVPIRVYVVNVELWNWRDRDHPNGLHVANVPLNRAATEAFVSALNDEALKVWSDTQFEAADGPEDATLYAKLEFHDGINEGKDYRNYLANVYVGGLGLTSTTFGVNVSPPGQRWYIVGYMMESTSEYAKYDVRSPGEASQIAFKEMAERVVNGWTCGTKPAGN